MIHDGNLNFFEHNAIFHSLTADNAETYTVHTHSGDLILLDSPNRNIFDPTIKPATSWRKNFKETKYGTKSKKV